jgi:zinc D-Ala-D-Ala carboxypeptidase
MSSSNPARTPARRTRATILAALVVVSATVVGVLGYQSLAFSSSSSATPSPSLPRSSQAAASSSAPPIGAGSPANHHDLPQGDHRGALDEADGVVADGVTVFDDEVPAVANLDPELLRAVRRAADAAGAGIEFHVNSGWRSPAYQEQLLRDAVSKYGSAAEASRWVATPDTSPHVSGDAVDIGHSDATAWLSGHGADYGLCQIYSNEPWHYELRPEAVDRGCPRTYADPTRDPRMQQ